MKRSHVIITGTGRTGTTFLVQLLTNLGLDTGFDRSHMVLDAHSKAGLEHNVLEDDAPYIVKGPFFCDIVEDVLARPDIEIQHVYIPMRDLYAAAESRRRATREIQASLSPELRAKMRPTEFWGGLWNTEDPEQQESALLMVLYNLLFQLSKTDIPVTLMHYPRIMSDPQYLYAKLKLLLGAIDAKTFARTHAQTIRPEWMNQFGSNDR